MSGVFCAIRRNLYNMTSSYIAGTHSIAYVTVPSEELGKKLAQSVPFLHSYLLIMQINEMDIFVIANPNKMDIFVNCYVICGIHTCQCVVVLINER